MRCADGVMLMRSNNEDDRREYERVIARNASIRQLTGGGIAEGIVGSSRLTNPPTLYDHVPLTSHRLSMLQMIHQQMNLSSQVSTSPESSRYFITPTVVTHPYGLSNHREIPVFTAVQSSQAFFRRNQFHNEANEAIHSRSLLSLMEGQWLRQDTSNESTIETRHETARPHNDEKTKSFTQVNKSDEIPEFSSSGSLIFSTLDSEPHISEKRNSSLSYSEHEQKPPAAKRQCKQAPKAKLDSRWLSSLEELKQFKQENGHTIVPRGYVENPKLASWVRYMT
jgi:Helicase associated domain